MIKNINRIKNWLFKKLNKIDSEIVYGCHGVEIMVGAGYGESV